MFLFSFAVLGILLPAGLILECNASKHMSASLIVQFVIVEHSAAGLAGTLASGRIRLMQFMFWTFVYLWLGLGAAMQVLTMQFPWNNAVSTMAAFQASVIIEIGLIAFSMALFVFALRHAASPPVKRRAPLEASPIRVVVLAVFSLVLTLYVVPRLGGFESLFGSRDAARAAADQTTGESTPSVKYALLNWGGSIPALWALVGLLYARFRASANKPRILLLILVILANVFVNNPISQPRFWAGTVVLGILFSAPWMSSLTAFKFGAVGVLLALLLVFPYADYFRTTSTGGDTDARRSLVASISEQLRTNGDYDAFQQIVNGVSYVSSEGMKPDMAIGIVLFPVPRSIWSAKAEAAGPVLAQFEGYSFVNLSSPLWIEAYIWGGWLSVCLVMFAYGLLVSKMDAVWNAHQGRPYLVAVPFIACLAFLQLMVLRGSLLHTMGPLLLLALIPLALAYRFQPKSELRSTKVSA